MKRNDYKAMGRLRMAIIAEELFASGQTVSEVLKRLEVSRSYLYRALNEMADNYPNFTPTPVPGLSGAQWLTIAPKFIMAYIKGELPLEGERDSLME